MHKGRPSFIPILATFALLAAGAAFANAQTSAGGPQFLITWRATNSVVPSFYTGKVLPSYGSEVVADLALVSNGKLQDLSGQTIYWYLNGTLVGSGPTVEFSPFGLPPNTLSLKVELPSYNGQYLIDSVNLPFVAPTAVIEAPYPGGNFSTNPVDVTALAYFFGESPSDLSYTWAVNGQTGSNAENPESAEITLPENTPSGSGITVSLAVTDPSDSVTADAQSTLTYSSQL